MKNIDRLFPGVRVDRHNILRALDGRELKTVLPDRDPQASLARNAQRVLMASVFASQLATAFTKIALMTTKRTAARPMRQKASYLGWLFQSDIPDERVTAITTPDVREAIVSD